METGMSACMDRVRVRISDMVGVRVRMMSIYSRIVRVRVRVMSRVPDMLACLVRVSVGVRVG